MMPLEHQVCSLELSKRLDDLQVKQKSIFVWEYYDDQCYGVKFIPYAIVPHEFNNVKLYPAFTADELGKMLPSIITMKEGEPFNNFRIRMEKCLLVIEDTPKENYLVNYCCDTTEPSGDNAWLTRKLLRHNIFDESLANCFAKVLINLIENKLVSI